MKGSVRGGRGKGHFKGKGNNGKKGMLHEELEDRGRDKRTLGVMEQPFITECRSF